MPPKDLTKEDIDKLTRDTNLQEIYLDPYCFTKLKQQIAIVSYDDRGEFFWYLTRKFRPLPFLKFGVIKRGANEEFKLHEGGVIWELGRQ